MIFNKYNFKIGDIAILDAEFNNCSKVIILGITPKGMFSWIRLFDDKDSKGWEVMTYRLTPEVTANKENQLTQTEPPTSNQ